MNSTRCLYKGHYLTCTITRADGGLHDARVAIISLGGDRTCGQRFIEAKGLATGSEALEQGLAAGRTWIDLREDGLRTLPARAA